MSIISGFLEKRKKKKQEIEDRCDGLITELELAIRDIELIFTYTHVPIKPDTALNLQKRCDSIVDRSSSLKTVDIRKASRYSQLITLSSQLDSKARSFRRDVFAHNDNVASMKAQDVYNLIGDVEGRKLDKQQLCCIAKEEHNHLVIAGAGTGKTTTVVGKIKYLLRSGTYKPEDILVLSFTNASASEMSERINRETGCRIDASTFHKLGMNIIAAVDHKQPTITDIKMRAFIKEQLNRNMSNPEYLRLLINYIHFGRKAYKSEFDFKSQKEYDDYLLLNPPTTIKKETVKSYGEVDIANYLYLCGIEYEYEKAYKIDTADETYGQYFPDFYLPEYDIYIEYFGINRNNEVPSYFSAAPGKSPSQTYLDSMKWKRQTHSSNNTVMIECYAYEKMDGTLLDGLRAKLISAGVEIKERSSEELWAEVSNDDKILNGIYELFETCINLIKSNNYSISQVRSMNVPGPNKYEIDTLLSLIEPIFSAYNTYLSEHSQIDFNDMINLAAQYVRDGKYHNPYKYVIVDEYQDIAKSRFMLLKALRDSADYSLFCVGDDWQSIYRFAGSDIGYILDFERFWGAAEVSRIETTYRFPQKLIEISGGFVMGNPLQIKKNIKGVSDSIGFPVGEINAYTDKLAVEFMVKRLNDLPKNSTVFFIGRYLFDADLLKDNPQLDCRYNNVTKQAQVFYRPRPDLKMEFITAHRSKGLQADYVFILNNKNTKTGFPSKIQDSAVLDLLLESRDLYPYAEERRLFYVALTRAKKKAYLLTVENYESEFVLELRARYGDEMKRERFECPLCGGKLVKRSGPYGEFYGCSNYKTRGCTFKRKI